MLEHEHADQLIAGPQRGVHARLGGGGQAGSLGPAEGGGAIGRAAADRHARRRRQLGVGELGREADPFREAHRPRGAVAAEEDGDDLAVDEFADAADGGLQDLVEVERRGQALGHAVKRGQQGVGLGQPADAVERE